MAEQDPNALSEEARWALAYEANKGKANNDFSQARDGNQKEAVPLTQQQQKSAEKLIDRTADPKTHPLDVKAAQTEHTFNTQAVGRPTTQSTVEAKKSPPKQTTYTSKSTGAEYRSDMAKQAAKNLDAHKREQQTRSPTTQVSKHTAPAPKPPGTPRNANRGKSTTQSPNEKPNEKEAPKSEHHKLEQAILAQAKKSRDAEQSKSMHQGKDKELENER